MLESNIMFNWPDVMMHCSLLEEDGRHLPNLFDTYRLYPCQDGYATIACGTDEQWQAYCEAMDEPALAADPRFLTAADRNGNIAEFFDTLAAMSSKFPVAQVVERCRAAGVPVAPVYLPNKVQEDEQVRARGLVREYRHPVVGRYLGVKPLASLFGEEVELAPAPLQGEHTEAVLTELGYDAAKIRSLHDEGVVKST